jgi:hypothetical protein
LAITSSTGGGRSVGIVRSQTQAMEFSLVLLLEYCNLPNFDAVLFGESLVSKRHIAYMYRVKKFKQEIIRNEQQVVLFQMFIQYT